MFTKRILRVAVIALALYLVGAIALAEVSLHPVRVRHGSRLTRLAALAEQSAQTSGGRLESVSIQAQDGTQLAAWFVQPAAWNGSVVVLLHGQSDSRAGMASYMNMFLQLGYSLLMPDSRGHGASGGVATYGFYEAGDIHSWFDWLQAKEEPSCVFALGESMGAGILLESLAVEHRFCAVVAESGFADFREAAYDRVSGEFSTGPWLAKTVLRPVIEGAFLEGRFVHGLNLETIRPEDAVAASATPILLIHGAADSHLRLRQSQLLHQANPKTELWVVPGVEHTLVFHSYPREFTERVLGFFAAHSNAGASAISGTGEPHETFSTLFT